MPILTMSRSRRIDLRRTSCPSSTSNIMFSGRAAVYKTADLFPQAQFIFVITHRVHIGRHLRPSAPPALLRSLVGLSSFSGFSAHIRDNARRFGSGKICARPISFAIRRDTELNAIFCDLKRRGCAAVLIKDAAQPTTSTCFYTDVEAVALFYNYQRQHTPFIALLRIRVKILLRFYAAAAELRDAVSIRLGEPGFTGHQFAAGKHLPGSPCASAPRRNT